MIKGIRKGKVQIIEYCCIICNKKVTHYHDIAIKINLQLCYECSEKEKNENRI